MGGENRARLRLNLRTGMEPRISRMITDKKGMNRSFLSMIIRAIRGRKSFLLLNVGNLPFLERSTKAPRSLRDLCGSALKTPHP